MPIPDQQQQFNDFPDYLSGNPNQNLQQFRGQINSLFNFKPIQQAGNAYIDSNFDQQRATAAAAAAASQRRAMQSGGQVGASFAQAGAMTPLYNQRNQQSLDLAKLFAQMQQSKAGLLGQVAGEMDTNALNRSGQQSQYGLAQQNMASQNSQFDQTFGLQEQEFGLQKRNFDLQALRSAPRAPVTYDFPGSSPFLPSSQQVNNGGALYQGNAEWAKRFAALQY
jgi:hypothetical protein